MKKKLNYYINIGSLLFGLSIFLLACQNESIVNIEEIVQEKKLKRISLSELNSRIGNSSDYSRLSEMFDINREKAVSLYKTPEASDNPYLLTDEIVVVEKGNITFYTFTIESDNTGNEFYNLVLAMDEFNDIRSTRILEYIPSDYWLQDTSQHFSGEVKIHNNDIFSVTDLNDIFSARSSDQCVIDVTGEWECGAGYDHEPGHIACKPENNAVTEFIITVHWGPCPESIDAGDSGGGGDSNSDSGDGGFSGGGDGGFPIDGGNTGGGGGGTGTSDGGSGNNNDEGNPPDEGEDCTLDSNGNCLTDDTTPLPPRELTENPCTKLKENISDNEPLKHRLHQLTLIDGQTESGLRADKDPSTGDYRLTPLLQSSHRKVRILTNSYTVVVVHSHPDDDVYAMYSGPDILKMAEIVAKVQSDSLSTVELTEITHILVTQDDYYALQFDDEASAQKLLNIYNNENVKNLFLKKLENDYDSDNSGSPLYKNTTTIDKQLEHIYNLFSKNGLNMTMYKANTDADNRITDWKRINKENRNEEPCS